jgi:hypothetical protein
MNIPGVCIDLLLTNWGTEPVKSAFDYGTIRVDGKDYLQLRGLGESLVLMPSQSEHAQLCTRQDAALEDIRHMMPFSFRLRCDFYRVRAVNTRAHYCVEGELVYTEKPSVETFNYPKGKWRPLYEGECTEKQLAELR